MITAPTRRGLATAAHRIPPLTGPILATFCVGTSGHAVAGLLPSLIAELHTSGVVAAQLATVFAAICGLAGPLLAVATGSWERRQLLAVCLLTLSAGDLLVAAAPTYTLLVAGRVLTALGAALTTATAVGLAARTVAPTRSSPAIARTLTGLTLSLLLGVPGAAAVASVAGFRIAMALIAALCAGAAVVVAATAPTAAAPPEQGLRERLAAAARPGVAGVLGGGILTWTSTGAVYPYLALLLGTHRGSGVPIGVYLAAYGLGAVIGTLAAGHLIDRFGPRAVLLGGSGSAAAALFLLDPATANPVTTLLVVAAWGAAAWSAAPPLNAWLSDLGDNRTTPLLLSLGGGIVYLGMGIGGVLGGALTDHAGPTWLPMAAAALALAGCLPLSAARTSPAIRSH
ncbi:MFS transporter [Amycolatopsis sp. cg9]|uniref:MFS transporter n=1 Tax=Amycolatopsis sp. cg9 TaxID=3238801 RepID=UPI0035231C9A